MPVNINTNNLGNRRHESNETIKLNLDLRTYDLLCRYILQPKNVVRLEHVMNLRKLLYIIDKSTYENDPEKVKRFNFLLKAIDARLENITDKEMMIVYINGGLNYTIDFLDYDHLDLSRDEVFWVHNLVTESLRYNFVYQGIDKLQDLCVRFKTSDFANRGNIIKEYEMYLDEMKNNFRKVHIDDNINDATFSLREDTFIPMITDAWNLITSPSRRLVSGMQGLNEMVGGGFEAGRVYMFLGVAGVGKSMTLLNLLTQMKRYNTVYDLKDKTKTPCIVLLTMENTVVETLTRLFDMTIENSRGMQNYQLDEVINLLRTEGQLVVNDSSPIDIVIKYKPNKSVDTNYLYTLYDDLKDQGYEMICMIQDHIKRIRSAEYNSDLRLELGDIVNEFKVFAADKMIPLITVSHLNREATKVIEEATRKGNQDNGKLLGKSNIGESLLMIDNVDVAFTLTKDYDKDGNCYMTFHRIKMRDRGSQRDYICQPFIPGTEVRLVCDIGGIPQFKESIHTNQIRNTTSIRMSGSSTMTNSMDAVIDFNDDLDDNSFVKDSFTLEPQVNHISQGSSLDEDDILGQIIDDIQRPHDFRGVPEEEQLQRYYQNPIKVVEFKNDKSYVIPVVSFGDKFHVEVEKIV